MNVNKKSSKKSDRGLPLLHNEVKKATLNIVVHTTQIPNSHSMMLRARLLCDTASSYIPHTSNSMPASIQ